MKDLPFQLNLLSQSKLMHADGTIQEEAESQLYESAVPKNAGESKSVVKSNPTQHKKSMTFIVGDSIVKDVKGWLFSREKFGRTYSFSDADTIDMHNFITPFPEEKPEEIICHICMNGLISTLNSMQFVNEILKLRLI